MLQPSYNAFFGREMLDQQVGALSGGEGSYLTSKTNIARGQSFGIG